MPQKEESAKVRKFGLQHEANGGHVSTERWNEVLPSFGRSDAVVGLWQSVTTSPKASRRQNATFQHLNFQTFDLPKFPKPFALTFCLMSLRFFDVPSYSSQRSRTELQNHWRQGRVRPRGSVVRRRGSEIQVLNLARCDRYQLYRNGALAASSKGLGTKHPTHLSSIKHCKQIDANCSARAVAGEGVTPSLFCSPSARQGLLVTVVLWPLSHSQTYHLWKPTAAML